MAEEKGSRVCREGGLSSEEYSLFTEGLGLVPGPMSGAHSSVLQCQWTLLALGSSMHRGCITQAGSLNSHKLKQNKILFKKERILFLRVQSWDSVGSRLFSESDFIFIVV